MCGLEEEPRRKRRYIFGDRYISFFVGEKERGEMFGEGKGGKYLGKFWSTEDSSERGKIKENVWRRKINNDVNRQPTE